MYNNLHIKVFCCYPLRNNKVLVLMNKHILGFEKTKLVEKP